MKCVYFFWRWACIEVSSFQPNTNAFWRYFLVEKERKQTNRLAFNPDKQTRSSCHLEPRLSSEHLGNFWIEWTSFFFFSFNFVKPPPVCKIFPKKTSKVLDGHSRISWGKVPMRKSQTKRGFESLIGCYDFIYCIVNEFRDVQKKEKKRSGKCCCCPNMFLSLHPVHPWDGTEWGDFVRFLPLM